MTEVIKSWWFAASDRLPHGGERKVVIGETHSLKGKIIICQHALHGSIHPFDALQYAIGPYLYQVEQWGNLIKQSDKIGSRHRKYIAMHDITYELRLFARQQALSVVHLWKAPEIVKKYLETGEESIRNAAQDAVWDVARVAARVAAQDAAWDAARVAAWAIQVAAWDAARAAAQDAAWDARNAARDNFLKLIEDKFNVHN